MKRRRTSTTAFLILDLVSEFSFDDAQKLLPRTMRVAKAVARLALRARKAGSPVIYVSVAPTPWESDTRAFISRCQEGLGKAIVRQIEPQRGDYFLFKPRHSAFYATSLHELLQRLRVDTLCLAGISTHQCVLFTAMDAHVREFALIVPTDCVAAPTPEETRHAMFILRSALAARTIRSASVRFD